MTISTRIIVTLMLFPLLYLAGVRFVSQWIFPADRSTLFETGLSHALSTPRIVEWGRATQADPAAARRGALRILTALDPFNADYHYLSSRALLESGSPDASSAIEGAMRLSVIDPKSRLLFGWAEARKRNVGLAYAEFDRAVALDPKRPESLAQQGIYLFRTGSADPTGKSFYHALALQSLRAALELDGSLYRDPLASIPLASLYRAAGYPGYAIRVLSALPDDGSLQWPLAIEKMALYYEMGEAVKATSLWKMRFNPSELTPGDLLSLEAAISTQKFQEFAFPLAQVHMAQGRYGQALRELNELTSRKGGAAEYRVALASIYERMGNEKEALRNYEEALRISPANQEAKKKVMDYYARKKGN